MNSYTKRLIFDEDKHEYSVGEIKIPSVTEIVSPFTFTKYRVDAAIVNQAAWRGTVIHELCADYDLGCISEDEMIQPDIALYLMAWKSFIHDYKPEWYYIEVPLASPQGFAGTIDRIGKIDSKNTVVDIKTTSSMDRASKISLSAQIGGYSILAEENDIPVEYENMMGVQLFKDGTYRVHYAHKIEKDYSFSSYDVFLRMLNFYKLMKGEKKIV